MVDTVKKLAVVTVVALLACSPALAQKSDKSKRLPDLVVKKIDVDADDNEIKVEVKNIGEGKAGPSVVNLTIFAGRFPVFRQSKPIDELREGQDKKAKFTVNLAQLKTAAQRFARLPGFSANLRAVATADANRQVVEANENNNTLTRNLP